MNFNEISIWRGCNSKWVPMYSVKISSDRSKRRKKNKQPYEAGKGSGTIRNILAVRDFRFRTLLARGLITTRRRYNQLYWAPLRGSLKPKRKKKSKKEEKRAGETENEEKECGKTRGEKAQPTWRAFLKDLHDGKTAAIPLSKPIHVEKYLNVSQRWIDRDILIENLNAWPRLNRLRSGLFSDENVASLLWIYFP